MKIILAEDDKESRESLAEFLIQLGHDVTPCEDGIEARDQFIAGHFDLVLTDIKMPRMTGIELLHYLQSVKRNQHFDVIIFTGQGDMQTAIDALRAGARDYLLKPIKIGELAALIERVEESLNLRKHQGELLEKLSQVIEKEHRTFAREETGKAVGGVIGFGEVGFFSGETRQLFLQALRLHSDRDITVLIEGETGTGKEVFARLIHHGDADTDSPFVDINCAALSPSLFESELFGYEAGAYTGALHRGNKGKIDLASGGTLFLDEIGELSIELQAKLLRVIQEREYYRVGGLKKVQADVRIICATNVNLEEKVREGLFRQDLYYRLNVGKINIPPLRERVVEIQPLAKMFLGQIGHKKGKKFSRISPEAVARLRAYSWPGNIRELRNLMEWVVFNYDGEEVLPEHLSRITKQPGQFSPLGQLRQDINNGPINASLKGFVLPEDKFPLADHIEEIVARALTINDGNKAKTARYLGISRRSLYSLLEKGKETV